MVPGGPTDVDSSRDGLTSTVQIMKNPALVVNRLVCSMFALLCLAAAATPAVAGSGSITFPGKEGPGKGKHIVFVSGDEEYRSEEGLPMLAKILSQRHGFTCTVLFALDPDGTINPNNTQFLSDPEELDTADAIVILTRFRNYPDATMKHFVDAYQRGIPIIGLRTATHAFNFSGGTYASYNGFGKRVLGEQWVDHWGRHKSEATRAIVEASSRDEAILNGVDDIFVTTDVYEAHLPKDAKILFHGQVLKGMNPTDPPADYSRKNSLQKQQGINDPMMPIAWTRIYKNETGKENHVLCTTMGASTDLQNEGLRRLIVNGVYWGLGMDVPKKADVEIVDAYHPTAYGFNGYRKGIHPADMVLGKGIGEGAGGAAATATETPRPATPVAAGTPLTLNKGDHVALLGGVLADRFQHDGWFESLVHAAFPRNELSFRNLSASGDEVATWQRSENFGTRDEWLKKTRADVIFAFYGYNESFKGTEGLPKFKQDLDKFVKATLTSNYSGKGTPRLVLFSPTADEKLGADFPDPTATNARVQAYAAAMAEVAQANGVQFVDLFTPSQKLFEEAAKQGQPLTINSHYLTAAGNKLLAPIMYQAVFGKAAPTGDIEKLRATVIEKNDKWHARYRTIDGYNVYGGRSQLSFPSHGKKITNYEVMQEEMSQRDAQTANDDQRVWAVARGEAPPAIENANLPPVEDVETNHPGSKPDKSWPFPGAEAAIAQMKVPKGCKVNLFASEEEFPELIKPLQMAWDTKGRLWVAAWRNYPERTPTSTVGDSILIFEDTKGTGHADKCTHFIDGLNAPTGFQFYKDGILVMQAPDLLFVRDSKGGDRADTIERVLMGMDSADSHHTTNSMVLDPGGATYLSDGVFHRTQVETAEGPVRNEDACIYRFEPRTGRFERYAPYGYANPHGRVFDYWGNDFITDATGNNTYFGPAISGHIDYPQKHDSIKEFWARPSRPCPGTGILSSRHFPAEFSENFLNCNVISFQGIYRVKVSEEGSGLKGETLEPLVSSPDPTFRPTAVNVGPDGAVYFADWSNAIIGHMQHHIRDPNRDHEHGRIYRITCEGRPLMTPPRIDGAPIPALLDLLKEPEGQTRTLAKIELGKHDPAEVVAAADKWIAGLDKADPAYEHNVTEGLWVHQWMNVVNEDLLKRVLRSPDPHARAAATRVLCYWRDRIADALPLLKVQVEDQSPRVRLEAVRAASFFSEPEAVDVALAAKTLPTDYYIDYTLKQTMKQLDPIFRKAVASGKLIGADNPAGLDYVIHNVSTAELLKLPKNPNVLQAILLRPEVPDVTRTQTLNELSAMRKTNNATTLLGMIDTLSKKDPASAVVVARMLPAQSPDDLKALRARIEKLATTGETGEVRQPAWAAVATADQSLDQVWKPGVSPAGLVDVLGSIPFVFDPDIRSTAFDRVKPLLASQLPPEIADAAKNASGSSGRYVRIELPRIGTLTLAEVQVFSEGRNIALSGHAKQSSTGYGADASRAIDGNTDGTFSSGTQTHTNENENNPWWEVDLGAERPIESIVVWNRTDSDGSFAGRLDHFTVTVLNNGRQPVFTRADNPAPAQSAKIVVGSSAVGSIRPAAIRAAVSMNKHQRDTFAALVDLIKEKQDVVAAARGIRVLPRQAWDKAKAADAAEALVAWAKTVPAADRTGQDYVETVQFAGTLAGFLPPDQAEALRKDLKSLRVAVFVINTVREQMRYDTPRLVVEAGKPFEVIVDNLDFMPHNLTIVNPGTRPSIAAVAANMRPDELDGQGRAYIPRSLDILSATKLLEPGQSQTLKLMAPRKEGDYDYFCTYPGHWEMMWGRMVVTKDVDAYLAEHPDFTLAAPAHEHGGH